MNIYKVDDIAHVGQMFTHEPNMKVGTFTQTCELAKKIILKLILDGGQYPWPVYVTPYYRQII